MNLSVRPAPPGEHAAFSLVEMIIALALMTVVLIGALSLLDTTNRVTRVQMGRADIQQSLRVAQDELVAHVRMAGRGGLLASTTTLPYPDKGVAVRVENNVPVDRHLFAADSGSPLVLEGTDIVTVRGIFDSPLYYLNFSDHSTFTIDPATKKGTVTIPSKTPRGDFDQDLAGLAALKDKNGRDALVLVTPYDESVYGVASIDWGSSVAGASDFTVAFSYENDAANIDPDNPANDIAAASVLSSEGRFRDDLFQRSGWKTAGIIQEYRYFIRDTTVDEQAGGNSAPRLSRARVVPNRDEYYDDEEEYEDIANYVLDLQVVLGFSDEIETDPTSGTVTESGTGDPDQWLFNYPADTLPSGQLAFVRVSSLVRSELPERAYQAPPVLRLEDRTYGGTGLNTADERKHQRFFLYTIVDVRNL